MRVQNEIRLTKEISVDKGDTGVLCFFQSFSHLDRGNARRDLFSVSPALNTSLLYNANWYIIIALIVSSKSFCGGQTTLAEQIKQMI